MKKLLQLVFAFGVISCLGFVYPVRGQQVFINEIHYDNTGTDAGEGVEITGPAGTNLAGWSLILYNGNNGAVYQTTALSGIIPDITNGFGFVAVTYPANGIQNGAPDGVALINANQEVIQFLSYEGSFTATSGPANGLTSTDIMVEEPAATPVGQSLQLTGTGARYEDFTWSGPISSTLNALNTGQSFGGGPIEPEEPEAPQVVTIAQARALPQGTLVTVVGTLSVVGELSGPAFLQDPSGGIPVFDVQVQDPTVLQIGDSVRLTAAVGAFNQQVQLVNVTELVSLGRARKQINPLEVNISGITNVLEGQLITIPNATFTQTKGLLFPENNYTITDGTGTVELRIDGDVKSLLGREIPDAAVSVTGVLGSFRGTLQLLPRFLADLPGTTPYQPTDNSTPQTTTLDVMTWNMEFFGSTVPGFGTGNAQLQLQNAVRLLDSVDADVIAVQEITDENLLQQLADQLGYERVCSDRFSYSFEAPDPTFPEQKICFLYKPEIITLVSQRVLFEAMYDSARLGRSTPLNNYPTGDPASFWSSGRLPFMISVDATVAGQTQRFQLVNIHAKSGSGTEDLQRRRFDIQVLKDTLDQYYPDANILLLGDYNDDVDVSIGGGPSTYSPFVTAENYRVVTATLSQAGLRSFISQDNVIDHVTISNELFNNYLSGSEALIIPFAYIPNYANTTSDHLPVVTRYNLAEVANPPSGCNLSLVTRVTQAEAWYGMWGVLNGAGAIDLSVLGGTAPYTYRWNAGPATQDITAASPGFYSVTVTDASGCTGMTTVYVGRKNDFLRVLSSHQDVSAPGGANGAIDLTVVGGVVPATYQWSNGATTEDLTGVAAGTYTVVVTDAFGRQAMTTIVVGEVGAPLALSSSHQNVSAAGKQDGSVDLTVTGGTAPYTYQWNTGAVTEDLHIALPGDYSVTVTDAMGATATTMVRVEVGRTPITMARRPASGDDLFTTTAGLTAYPNPVVDRATVNFSLAIPGQYTLDLYDIRGAKVKTLASGTAQANQNLVVDVPVAGFAKGVYLLKLVTDKGTAAKRLLIGR